LGTGTRSFTAGVTTPALGHGVRTISPTKNVDRDDAGRRARTTATIRPY
jgi:hypothetical protein